MQYELSADQLILENKLNRYENNRRLTQKRTVGSVFLHPNKYRRMASQDNWLKNKLAKPIVKISKLHTNLKERRWASLEKDLEQFLSNRR